MAYHNGMQFSTYDFDNDAIDNNCGYAQQGGWWYKGCYHANLNGPHTISSLPGVDQTWARRMWNVGGNNLYIPSVEMKVRQKICITAADSC